MILSSPQLRQEFTPQVSIFCPNFESNLFSWAILALLDGIRPDLSRISPQPPSFPILRRVKILASRLERQERFNATEETAGRAGSSEPGNGAG